MTEYFYYYDLKKTLITLKKLLVTKCQHWLDFLHISNLSVQKSKF